MPDPDHRSPSGLRILRWPLSSVLFQLLLLVCVVVVYNRLVFTFHSISSRDDFSEWAAPLYAFKQTIPSLSAEVALRWIAPIVIGAVWIALSMRSIDRETECKQPAKAHGRAVGLRSWKSQLRAALGFVLMLNISTAMMDTGTKSPLTWPFSMSGKEYYGDAVKVQDPIAFLRDYPTLNLAHHPRTHPPGGVMFLWAASKLVGSGLLAASLVAIAFTALTIIPATLLAREFLGERALRIFMGLYVLTPNLVLFGATSMDGVFALVLVTTAYVFFKLVGDDARGKSLIVRAINAGFWLALSTFFTYATVALVVLLITGWLLQLLNDRERALRTFVILSIAATTLVACFGFLYLTTGCNIIACARASIAFDAAKMSDVRAFYWDVSFTNLLAFFVGSGFIATKLWLRSSVTYGPKPAHRLSARRLSVALLLTVFGLSFSTLFTREVERVWMFLTPLLLIGAAAELDRLEPPTYRTRWTLAAMALLSAQTWLTQLLLYTMW